MVRIRHYCLRLIAHTHRITYRIFKQSQATIMDTTTTDTVHTITKSMQMIDTHAVLFQSNVYISIFCFQILFFIRRTQFRLLIY